jgi:prepilin-type N-terminal cleavage/methylation domain-containing protein
MAANFSGKAGFTLIEMMVAVFVFSIVMTLATGAIFNVVAANKSSQAIKSVMDNLNSALDSMSRDIRYGTIYNCGNTSVDFSEPASCTEGASNDNIFAFVAKPTADNPAGDHVIYEFLENQSSDHSGSIYKCIGSTLPGNCDLMTAPEVHIQNLHFYVQGASELVSQQPQVLISISGYAMAGSNESYFNIETMIDQRKLDMCKTIVPSNLSPDNCPTS